MPVAATTIRAIMPILIIMGMLRLLDYVNFGMAWRYALRSGVCVGTKKRGVLQNHA